MRLEPVEFVGAGGARLAATLRRPDGDARGGVLLAHCFTCSKDLHTTTRLARHLTDAGFVTMAFDFTGLGESGGSFTDSTVTVEVGDIVRAAATMIGMGIGPCLLLGHSLGGAAAVLAAGRIHTLDGLICVAAPSDVGHVRQLLLDDGAAADATGPLSVTIGGRPFVVGRGFLEDLDRHDVVGEAAALHIPMLVVEAGADTVVGPEETRRLAHAAGADIVTIEGADHLFSDPAHARRLGEVVVEWAARHAAR